MATKYLYVVTSTPQDIYLEQTYLSMYSLLQHEPDAHIVLLTDNRTHATLAGPRAKILDMAAEKIVVDFADDVSNMRRSRHLKTTMRNLVDGDFLYIDGDTIVCEPLAEIGECEHEIGAVEDAHRPLDQHYGKEKLQKQAKMLGFDFSGEQYYFNGGLMYVKDTPGTREFFRRWHDNWRASSAQGINLDMPALIKTNIEMGHMIKKLDGKWNCQVMYGQNYYKTAKIVHYFASRYNIDNGGTLYGFMDNQIFAELKPAFAISASLHEKVMNPLSQFANNAELIGGTDVYIINTHVYKLVRMVYNRFPKAFALMQSMLFKLNNAKKKSRE